MPNYWATDDKCRVLKAAKYQSKILRRIWAKHIFRIFSSPILRESFWPKSKILYHLVVDGDSHIQVWLYASILTLPVYIILKLEQRMHSILIFLRDLD